MARYEIVGIYDDPWLAKADKLADEISQQFSNIEFKRTLMDEFQWNNFKTRMNSTHGWDIKMSPVIWEILVEPNGRANLIGGINDFCEYAKAFFGIVVDFGTLAIKNRLRRNTKLFVRGFHGKDCGEKSICNMAVINGPIRLLETFLTQLLSPLAIASPNVLFNISIFNENLTQRHLQGLCMETVDLCSPSLYQVNPTASLTEVMYNAHVIVILDDLRRQPEETTADWLNRIDWRGVKYSEVLNTMSSDCCRVLIGGEGPNCYMAEIMSHLVSKRKVRSGHLVTVGQHIVNQGKSLIGQKTEVPPGSISRLYAYGWPGSVGAWIEVRDAIYRDGDGSIQGPPPCEIPLAEIALNPHWLFHSFSPEFLQIQENRICSGSSQGSWLCLAEAASSLLHLWFLSTSKLGPVPGFRTNSICCPPDTIPPVDDGVLPVISVGIKCSKKSSFPRGTFMVQPCVCFKGKWMSAGIISQGTLPSILHQINLLWKRRQILIFRDKHIQGVISSYDIDLSRRHRRSEHKGEDGEVDAETLLERKMKRILAEQELSAVKRESF